MFGNVEEAWNLGAAAVGATIYYGSDESNRQIQEVAHVFPVTHTNLVWQPYFGVTYETVISK